MRLFLTFLTVFYIPIIWAEYDKPLCQYTNYESCVKNCLCDWCQDDSDGTCLYFMSPDSKTCKNITDITVECYDRRMKYQNIILGTLCIVLVFGFGCFFSLMCNKLRKKTKKMDCISRYTGKQEDPQDAEKKRLVSNFKGYNDYKE